MVSPYSAPAWAMTSQRSIAEVGEGVDDRLVWVVRLFDCGVRFMRAG